MARQIFINLPTKNLQTTARFFSKLGFRFNPQFSDENAQCMIISDDIYVMFLTESYFRSFTKKDIPDTATSAGAIYSLTAESREAVDDFMQRCIQEGGRDVSQPQTWDFMHTRTFEDPDGHLWEIFYMDMTKVANEPKAQPAK
jgi:uncharacterized protein